MSRIFWRLSLRQFLHHPWQVGLTILGIMLGVSVVVSIDLANESARRAFALSTRSVAGRATHWIIGGPRGLPETLYRRLRMEGIRPSAPVVEGYVTVPSFSGLLHLLGIDPFAEGPFRPAFGIGGWNFVPLLTRPASGFLSEETARRMGLKVGETFVIRVGGVPRTVTLVGLLRPEDRMSRAALESLLVTDIATAQELLGLPGRLSRIDLILPKGEEGKVLLRRLTGLLPPGAEVVPSTLRSRTIIRMTRAFHLNLTALSLLALIVGMFLVYNTMTFSVVTRRPLLGILRALGVTRGEIFTFILGEALLIGLLGTVLGVLTGIVLGRGLLHLVTRTINDLYFVLTVRNPEVPPFSLVKGTLMGIGAVLLAALAPAFEATTAPPRSVLSRSAVEVEFRRALPWTAFGGILFLLLGSGLLLIPTRNLLLSFIALFTMTLGSALLTPVAMVGLLKLFGPLLGRLFGVFGNLAVRGVVSTLSRTAVAIAALVIAVSATIGVGTMIGSFRKTVVHWLEASLKADIYVSPPSQAGQNGLPLDPELVGRLTSAPGVRSVSTYRGVVIESAEGLTHLVALDLPPEGRRAFRFKEGDPASIWPAFEGGAVLVSEPYAYHHRLHVGSLIRLRTDRGERKFPVAGIFYDYGSDRGVVMVSRRTYERFWEDRGISSLGIYTVPGSDIDRVIETLRHLAGPDREILIRSNRALREASLAVFDRTFTITTVLRLLALLVAFIGVFSALMALQLERVREIGILRATGLTPGQVLGLVTLQTGLMGFVAGLLAIPTGLVLAMVLIFVINRRSFGWTLQMTLLSDVLLQALLLAFGAALLAGLYPALKMARTPPALALREE